MILSLKKEIRKQPDWQKNYLEIFKAILISKTSSQKFPIDEDFEKFLSEADVYGMRNDKFLMSSIEHHNCAFEIDLEDLEIEHIMPQKLSGSSAVVKWRKMLGNNWQEIHKKYLHTIGNLSLTSSKKNKEMSNKDFLSKQNVDYQTSKLKLSKNLGEGEIWNEEKIKERADWLIAIAKKVWSYPTSSCKIERENEEDIFSLKEFKNEGITKAAPFLIEIENKKIQVKNWINVTGELLKIFHEFSPTDFKRISNMAGLERFFNKEKEGKLFAGKIRNNIVVGYEINVNQSAISIIENLKKICEEINFDKEILIYYKPKESK